MRLMPFAIATTLVFGLAACAADTPPRSTSAPVVSGTPATAGSSTGTATGSSTGVYRAPTAAGSSTGTIKQKSTGSLTGTYSPVPPSRAVPY